MLPPNLPSDISQKRLAKAFEKAGFILDAFGGKGGHYKMTDPKTNKFRCNGKNGCLILTDYAILRTDN